MQTIEKMKNGQQPQPGLKKNGPVKVKTPESYQRRITRDARREFEAGRAVLPREKVIHRPVDVPARMEASGQRRSELTVNGATMTKRKHEKCSLKGSDSRGSAAICG